MIVKSQGEPVPIREERGRPIIQIGLDKTPDESWIHWFRRPTSYKWTTSLTPQMCRISGNKLEFPSDYAKAEEQIQLVLEWIELASKASEEAATQRKEILDRRKKEEETEQERLAELAERLKQKFKSN